MIPKGAKVRAARQLKVDDEVVPAGELGFVARVEKDTLFPYMVNFETVKAVPVLAKEIVEVP